MTVFWSAVVNGAILSALLSLTLGIVLRMTPRRALNAATRYAIWWIALAITLALPLIALNAGRHVQTLPAHPTHVVVEEAGPVYVPQPQLTATGVQRASIRPAISLPIEIPASQWQWPTLLLWIAASLILLARVIVSYAALYRRSMRATDAPPHLNGLTDRWRQQSGATRRTVRLAISNEVEIPIATGPLRPAILIPTNLFDQMSAQDLDQIGLHEAAHLARRDDYALLAQRLIEALFALHPVVRWITRQIDLEREIACDDIVVGSSDRARSYADCLTRTIALCGCVRRSLAAANVADGRSHLTRRVELLVEERPDR